MAFWEIPRFAEFDIGDLISTDAGRTFTCAALDECASHVARKSRFTYELEDFMNEEAAEQTLRAIISLALRRSVRLRRRACGV